VHPPVETQASHFTARANDPAGSGGFTLQLASAFGIISPSRHRQMRSRWGAESHAVLLRLLQRHLPGTQTIHPDGGSSRPGLRPSARKHLRALEAHCRWQGADPFAFQAPAAHARADRSRIRGGRWGRALLLIRSTRLSPAGPVHFRSMAFSIKRSFRCGPRAPLLLFRFCDQLGTSDGLTARRFDQYSLWVPRGRTPTDV